MSAAPQPKPFKLPTPSDPSSYPHLRATLNGLTYTYIDVPPFDAQGVPLPDPTVQPTLLLVHGFPDLWYGWRHQIVPWAKRGWRVVVPSLTGYAGTDAPADIGRYSLKSVSSDLVALLDLLGLQRVILVGHDWGAATVWRMAQYHPDRVLGVAGLALPYLPPNKEYIPLEEIVKRRPNFNYQLYLADERNAEELERNISTFIHLLHRSPSASETQQPRQTHWSTPGTLDDSSRDSRFRSIRSDLLTPAEHAFYVQSFSRSRLLGPTSWYRTTHHRFLEEQAAGVPTHLPQGMPVLFVQPTKDFAIPEEMARGMEKFVKGEFRRVRLEGCGHWVMVERSEEVEREVAQWVEDVVLRKVEKREREKAKL